MSLTCNIADGQECTVGGSIRDAKFTRHLEKKIYLLIIYLFRILGCGWLMHFCSHAEHQLTTLVGSSGCQRIIGA